MKINFLGDFVAPTVQGLELSGGLLEILASGDFNSINFEAPILPPPYPYHQLINKILWVLACMISLID